MATPPISTREVLLLLLNAYRWPCHNMYDVREAELAEAEALAKARHAVPSPDDPPEFAAWLTALLAPDRTAEAREEAFDAICEYFDPENREGGQGMPSQHHSPQSA